MKKKLLCVVVFMTTFLFLFGFNMIAFAESAPQSNIEITEFTKPSGVLKSGGYFVLKGKINSVQNLENVTAGIYYRNDVATSQVVTKNPKSTHFDLKTVDEQIYFDTLSDGLYKYKVTATDVMGYSVVLLESDFQIGNIDSKSEITCENLLVPDGEIIKGEKFVLSGEIISIQPLYKVKAEIIDSAAQNKISCFENSPMEKKYNISDDDRKKLNINNLEEGMYIFRLTAEDYTGYEISVSETEFSVVKVIPEDASIDISDYTLPSGNLKQGAFFNISGIVSSVYDLKNITGEITLRNGDVVQSVSILTNSKKYNLFPDVDYGLLFDKLEEGFYKYVVKAEDVNGYTEELLCSNFTIGNPQILAGDANDDGVVSVSDSVAVAAYVANPNKNSKINMVACDMYDDGINAGDALMIQHFATGILDDLSQYIEK